MKKTIKIKTKIKTLKSYPGGPVIFTVVANDGKGHSAGAAYHADSINEMGNAARKAAKLLCANMGWLPIMMENIGRKNNHTFAVTL